MIREAELLRLRLIVVLVASLSLGGCARQETSAGSVTSPQAVPVILISIDTLRADHLPIYGYAGVATPALDALAKDSIVFENAYSHCPLTLPSHVSLLTGLLPAEHRVRNNIGYRFDAKRFPSIPTLLAERGYATGGVVSAYVLRGSTGLGDSFDFYDDGISFQSGVALGDLSRPGDEAAESALRWIGEQHDRPFFVFLHLFEPHAPYEPASEFREMYAARPYDGEIATADRIVGRFLQQLKSQGLYDRSLVILTSDHGEGLGDHGEQEHGVFLYREAIRVPLIVKFPAMKHGGSRVTAPVQLIDVLPTVAEVTGIELPPGLNGVSLAGTLERPSDRRIFSETMYPRIHLGMSDLRSLTDARYQFIDAPRAELYDVGADPGQRKNIATDERRAFAALRKEMDTYDRSLESPSNITPEEARKLAALGYVGSAAAAASISSRDPKDFVQEIEAMKSASMLASAGKLDEAIAQFESIVARSPENADAWSRLGATFEKAERYDEAAAAYRRVLELVPGLTEETALSLASIELNRGRLDEAVRHAELAMRTNAGAAHLLLGRIALERRDYIGAEREASLAGSDAHYRIQGQVLLAQAMTKLDRAPEALSVAEAAGRELEKSGREPVRLLEFARGDALARLGRIAEAKEAFSNEIRLFPGDRQAYAHLAGLYLLEGRKRDAHATLVAMASARPGRESCQLALDTTTALGDEDGAKFWRRQLDAWN